VLRRRWRAAWGGDRPRIFIPAVIGAAQFPASRQPLGCLLVDVQHDFSESYFAAAVDADPAAIEAEFGRPRGFWRWSVSP